MSEHTHLIHHDDMGDLEWTAIVADLPFEAHAEYEQVHSTYITAPEATEDEIEALWAKACRMHARRGRCVVETLEVER